MFKKIKGLILKFIWFLLPKFLSDESSRFVRVWSFLSACYNDVRFILAPINFFFKNFFSDLRLSLIKYFTVFRDLVVKHRLMYIVRLAFLIFILYRPTLIELDSLYWTLSTLFYFVTNNLFFLTSSLIPFTNWSLHAMPIKALILISFLPALYTSKRLKKRLMRKNKIILQDDEVYFLFQWAQRIFLYFSYFLIWYVSFFIFSIFIPFLYLYLADFTFVTIKSFYLAYVVNFVKDYKYLAFIFDFFFGNNFVYYGSFVFVFFFKYIFILFHLNVFSLFLIILSSLKYYFIKFFIFLFFIFISVIGVYCSSLLDILKNLLIFGVLFKNIFFVGGSLIKINALIDVFKNFLFSDNFIIFLFFIFKIIFVFIFSFLLGILKVFFSFLSYLFLLILPDYLVNYININFSIFSDFFLIKLYSFFITILDWLIPLLNSYFKDLTIFGLISTWYEYLNHGVQRGILRNSYLNWAFVHLYASIIAFWFLDFDFRVSVKTPPKTPHMLLKEAKRTQDWIPQSMDFLTLQTNEAKIYFAMLDISFEHVESLQFIYGDFEYIDEEYDTEDETPDEEELFNESEETLKVREIIESDLGFTKRPTKMRDADPLDSNTSLERHYLSEIVGEPELLYIEDSLKWMFEALYTPTFEELHYRDSLFSDWIFDPDEDLTFFEFLVLFPFLFYCVYVWFFHRRRGKHYRAYLRFFIPSRRFVFSGWWVEDFLGLPIGEWGRYFFDKMRHHTAPDVKFRRVHKFRMYRARQKFKLMQLETFHFERIRLLLYKNTLKNWEDFTQKSMKFLAPNRKKHYLYSTVMQFKRETRDWTAFGDWSKYFWKPDPRPERVTLFLESLQVSLPRLVEKYVNKRSRKKFRRSLWRTVQHIPGHLSMPYYPKKWYSRFSNTYLFFPSVDTKYNYSYYNYIGWRSNRSRWRRYAFTPGNVTDKVFEYNRSLQQRDYNLYKRWQRRRRLMRVFQF